MSLFRELLSSIKITPNRILDIGSGHGVTTAQLQSSFPVSKVISLDRYEDICKYVKEHINDYVICADALKLPLKDETIDFVACDQLIEHIEEQNELVEEINRVLRVGGYIIVGSVLRKRVALAFARNKEGKISLSSDHVREYKSEHEFANVFNGYFKIIKISTAPVWHPLWYTIYRVLVKMGFAKYNETFVQSLDPVFKASLIGRLISAIRLPRPGFYYIYLMATKQ